MIFVFPDKEPDSNSVLILKKVKTDSGERYVFMTEQLKEELFKYLKSLERQKKYYGEDLPEIKFHGLRHSGITYKLYLSGVDIKAVQGDSGHASAAMVTDNYSHMQDSGRFELSQKIGKSFYQHEGAEEMEADQVNEETVLDLANKLKKNLKHSISC